MELQDLKSTAPAEASLEDVDRSNFTLLDLLLLRIKSGIILYSVLTASIMSILVGTTLSYSSFALLEFIHYPDPTFQFDTLLVDIFGAIAQVGAAIGGPLALWMANALGRKASLVFNPGFYAIGYFIILSTSLATNGVVFKTFLIIGRFITGIGLGWSTVAVGIYVSEISPSELRNVLGVITDTSVSTGALLIYGLSSLPEMKYYHLALIQIGISVFYLMLVMCIPETPLYTLWKYKDKAEVIQSLTLLFGSANDVRIHAEYEKLKNDVVQFSLSVLQQSKLILCTSYLLMPFLLLLFLSIFQELSGGQSIVIGYAGLIFKTARAPNPNAASTYSVGVSLVVASIVTGLFMEKVGKKVLLSISAAGMLISTTLIGTSNFIIRPVARCPSYNVTLDDYVYDSSCQYQFPLTAVAVAIFTLSFAIGVGPIPSLLLYDYMPQSVTGFTRGVTEVINGSVGAMIIALFPAYLGTPGSYLAWWSLAAINLFGLIFIVLFVKETNEKNYNEIKQSFCFGTGYSCVYCKCSHDSNP